MATITIISYSGKPFANRVDDPCGRRNARQQFSFMADFICGVLYNRCTMARFYSSGVIAGRADISIAAAKVGRRMTQMLKDLKKRTAISSVSIAVIALLFVFGITTCFMLKVP